jgi:hypothetical protein
VDVLRRWWRWLMTPRAGGGRVRTCPRCGSRVVAPGLHVGAVNRFGYVAPTVAEVVAACGCERDGRAPVPEWRERARRRHTTW